MDKIRKLKMFHNLIDAQGIRAVVNVGTYVPAPTPHAAPTSSPTTVVEVFSSMCKVDPVDAMTTLTVHEPT